MLFVFLKFFFGFFLNFELYLVLFVSNVLLLDGDWKYSLNEFVLKSEYILSYISLFEFDSFSRNVFGYKFFIWLISDFFGGAFSGENISAPYFLSINSKSFNFSDIFF